ncbi:MAG: hypothetical protein AUJ72_00795 [Candidatus Omnitrophica bacterium CG1_02_46_14]|nr:MAG: hypothetical protein AUJ72_00795 [Candidatus Omnitrophica bacterium CG1_02_46_14]
MNESPKIRIAIVDDEKMLLSVFSSLLNQQHHYQAECFSNPHKAFDAITNHPGRYQLVIADIYMPQMDGITFAKMVRQVFPDLPFMFMTGEVNDELRESALSLGRVTFLEKPFPLEKTIKEAIPDLLGLPPKPTGNS